MASQSPAQLTIVVTTYNRYPRLLRLLRYAATVNSSYPILVLDSSHQPIRSPELEARLSGSKVEHVRYAPTLHPFAKTLQGLRRVSTPYVVLWADDDLMAPRTLDAAVNVLETSPGHSLAQGQVALFKVATSLRGREIQWIDPYPAQAIAEANGATRLRAYLSQYAMIFYAVHRTELIRRNFERCCAHELGYFWGELLLGSLSVIQGKVEVLRRLQLLREAHAGMDSFNESGGRMDVFDWVTGRDFSRSYVVFRGCLAEELAQRDGIAFSRAHASVKEAFWGYLLRALGKGRSEAGSQGRMIAPRSNAWVETARRLPGLRSTWRALRTTRMPSQELTVEAMRRPHSPYHEDFLPMERAILEHDIDESEPPAMAGDEVGVGSRQAVGDSMRLQWQ